MSRFFNTISDFQNTLIEQDIFVGTYRSPYGLTLIQATMDDVLGIYFCPCEDEINKINTHFCQKYGLKNLIQNQAIIDQWGVRIFMSKDKKIPFKTNGSDFQIKVWQQLLTIPFGQTTTYRQIALTINHSKALRAVGTAIGANPLSYVIPCHRVLRHNGDLGGYRWGQKLKQKILEDERRS